MPADSSRRGHRKEETDDADHLVGADRVLAVLRELARHGEGIGLDALAQAVRSRKPTVHRALVALRRAGFAAQDGRGHYVLGDDFLRLAFTHHENRPDHSRVRPALTALTARFEETSHYAVLDDRSVVYRAKVDPPSGPIKLSSTVGGRNPAHCTAVGKVLLAHRLSDDAAVRDWVRAGRLERRTDRTLTTQRALVAELSRVREQGFAVDDQESDHGVNCVAVPVWLASPSPEPTGAVSVSALAYRTPLEKLVRSVGEVREIVGSAVGGPPSDFGRRPGPGRG
ncbi:MAG: IclR family transcriptional regulator [Nocardioidaceae bacterium]